EIQTPVPDITTTRIFSNAEQGITATKLNDIVAGSSVQPAFYSGKPVASTVDPTDTMLVLKAAGTYAQAPFSTVISSVSSQLPSSDPEIWSVRLHSFNALGNPNFEIDQRTAGAGVSAAVGTFALDRWQFTKTGTLVATAKQTAGTVLLPGTN